MFPLFIKKLFIHQKKIMKTRITAIITFLLIMLIGTSQAQTARRGVQQHQRIKQGVRSGEITRTEAANLRNGQREIRQDVREARADGVVTPGERREIKQDQRQESRKIIRKTHNRRDRH
jgi:hypothetical protein